MSTARCTLLPRLRFAPSYPAAPAALGARLQRAAVEDGRRRLCRAPCGKPEDDAQIVDNRGEGTGLEPPLALLIDRLPRREVVRQHPPFRPGTHDPAQGVEDDAQIVVALRGIEAHQGQIGEDEVPFVVADIGGVGLAFRSHTSQCTPLCQVHNRL